MQFPLQRTQAEAVPDANAANNPSLWLYAVLLFLAVLLVTAAFSLQTHPDWPGYGLGGRSAVVEVSVSGKRDEQEGARGRVRIGVDGGPCARGEIRRARCVGRGSRYGRGRRRRARLGG